MAELFSKGCCLCGRPCSARRVGGPYSGAKYCADCLGATGFVGLYGSESGGLLIDAEITRRRALTPPTQPAAEFYSEQPPDTDLPEILPAGTRYIWPSETHIPGTISLAVGALELVRSQFPYYVGKLRHENGHESHALAHWPAKNFDWSTVRKSPPAPSQAERIPEDVALLLLEARKYRPECVVSLFFDDKHSCNYHVLWAGTGTGFALEVGSTMRHAWSLTAGTLLRTELDRAIRDRRVWPLADARKLAAKPVRETTAAGSADASDSAQPAAVAKSDLVLGVDKASGPDESIEYISNGEWVRRIVDVTDEENDEAWQERQAALSASDNPLDRLAARRQRSSRAEIEGGRAKGAERHPADWDVDDVQESYCTSSWSGR